MNNHVVFNWEFVFGDSENRKSGGLWIPKEMETLIEKYFNLIMKMSKNDKDYEFGIFDIEKT